MADPSFNSDERVLIRTPGIVVKSIPFEGTLTNRRIILTDRARNILPSKDIPLATVQRVGVGENTLHEPILNISVIPHPGEVRQMVLTFSRQDAGNPEQERDEWARLIQEYLTRSAAPPARAPQPAPAQPRYTVVNTPEQPVPAPAPAPQAAAPAGETVFCTRCGNRVPVDSAFCNRCGTPIVAPTGMRHAAAPQQQPPRPAAPVAPEPAYTPPPAPAYQAPAPAPVRYEEPAPARQTVPLPAPQPAPQKPAKKGFLSGIFASKPRPAAARQARPPAAPPAPRKSRMPGKKTIMIAGAILVVIAVVAAAALFILPMLSSGLPSIGGSSGSSSGGSSSAASSGPLTNTGVDSVTVRETTPVSVPANGVWVKVSYLGSYSGTYGMPVDLQKLADSGDRTFEVVNASGPVQVTLAKQDSSTKHELAVEIYKDGKLLKSGKTSDPYGKVTISADVGGTPPTAVPTTSAAGTVTTKAPAGNTTQTAAATTAKTPATATTTTKKT